jgi:hypothetical protein
VNLSPATAVDDDTMIGPQMSQRQLAKIASRVDSIDHLLPEGAQPIDLSDEIAAALVFIPAAWCDQKSETGHDHRTAHRPDHLRAREPGRAGDASIPGGAVKRLVA